MKSKGIEEAMQDPNVQKSFGTSGLLTIALLEGCHQESSKLAESLIKSEYLIGWDAGYAAGFSKGIEEIRLEMQRLLGIYVKTEYLPDKETMREQDFQARQKERGK